MFFVGEKPDNDVGIASAAHVFRRQFRRAQNLENETQILEVVKEGNRDADKKNINRISIASYK